MIFSLQNIVDGTSVLQKRQPSKSTLSLPTQRALRQRQEKGFPRHTEGEFGALPRIDPSTEREDGYYPPVYKKFVSLLMVNGDRSKASIILARALVDYRQALSKERRIVPVILSHNSPIRRKGESSQERKGEASSLSTKESLLFGGGTSKLLMEAINNVKPSLEVRRVRIAATTYTVPAVIQKGRQDTLAIRWLLEGAKRRRKRGGLSFSQSLTQELVDAYNKQGHALQRRDQLHALAESNRAYVRYRWW
jgi:small subunit ribosomal protein S7